jgi:hypothetical protein
MKILKRIRRFFYIKPKYPYELIIKVLKEAKEIYNQYSGVGMCSCLVDAILKQPELNPEKHTVLPYSRITEYIPEHNPKFFGIKNYFMYWWPRYDRESRNKAFDKLINLYEAKLKKYNEIFN